MTKEEIRALLLKTKDQEHTEFSFSLKKRNMLTGFIVQAGDYRHLNAKNYWHILTPDRKEAWESTRNINLLLLFPGDAFSKMVML